MSLCTEPNGSSLFGLMSPSRQKGSSSSSALVLPDVLWPRNSNRPPAKSNTWFAYSYRLMIPARRGRQRPELGLIAQPPASATTGDAKAGGERTRPQATRVGASSEAAGEQHFDRGFGQRCDLRGVGGVPAPMAAVLGHQLVDGVPKRLGAQLTARAGCREHVAEQQRDLLDGRVGRERYVRERAIVDDQCAALGAPLDLVPRCGSDGALDPRALTEEVRALFFVEGDEEQRRILGQPPRELLGTGAVLPLRGWWVAPRLIEQLLKRRRFERDRRIAQQQRKPAAIDGEQRLVLALLAPCVTLVRARRVLEHAPGAEQVEPVGERDALAARAEVDAQWRLDIGAGALDVPGEVGDRGLRAAPLERDERQQQQYAARSLERRPFVRRPLAATDRTPGRIRSGRRRPSGVGGPDARAAVLPTSSW